MITVFFRILLELLNQNQNSETIYKLHRILIHTQTVINNHNFIKLN
jgi:hypothetical protein